MLNPNNGQLLVGGQADPVYQIKTDGSSIATASSGVNAFHLVVDPNKNVVWASGIPGNLSSVPINPFGAAGTVKTLSGDNTTITGMAFTPSGDVFYTSSGAGGVGDFGKINLTTGVTTRILSGLTAAHGIQYDPFTGDLILGGGDEIAQIDPLNPTVVLSSALFTGDTFDQGTVDGLGHIFWATNNGNFFFMDYSTGTKLVGNATNFVSDSFFKDALDDIAPPHRARRHEPSSRAVHPPPSRLRPRRDGGCRVEAVRQVRPGLDRRRCPPRASSHPLGALGVLGGPEQGVWLGLPARHLLPCTSTISLQVTDSVPEATAAVFVLAGRQPGGATGCVQLPQRLAAAEHVRAGMHRVMRVCRIIR